MKRILGLTLLAGVVVMASAGSSIADTLYLRDESKHEGTVTLKDDKYFLEKAGKTTEFSAADVVYVRYGPSSTSPASPVASSRPVSLSSSGGGAINIEALTEPESMAFLLMRRLGSTLPGSESVNLRQDIEKWRAAVHDKKRKIGVDWLSPKEFVARRTRYQELLTEASDLLRKNKNAKGPALYAKLREAAATWQDPLLREFLIGIAELEGDNLTGAQMSLQNCARKCPQVPAFAQAKALVLLAQNKGLEAVTPASDFLRMRSDSLEAFMLLKRAIAKAPGASIKQPALLEAQDLLGQYEDTSNNLSGTTAARSFNWSMPLMGQKPSAAGKGWSHRDDALPLPTFDRLVFRQAVAVPISDTLLLVDNLEFDGKPLTDAADIFVRINDKTIAGAVVKPVPGKPANLPLAVISVPGYAFTPLEQGQGPELSGKSVTLYSAPVIEEMGGMQTRSSRVLASDSAITITPTLRTLPGEAAGPVISEDGRLVQFVAGKIDAMVDGGGADKAYAVSDLGAFFAMGKTKSTTPVASKLKRTGSAEAAAGRAFIVYVVSGERFEN